MTSLFAYLDAGTGSIVIQAIIGTAVGTAYAFRHFSKRLFSFNKLSSRKNAETEAE